MPPPRPSPKFSSAANRKLMLVSTERRERVQRVVDFMDRVEGLGWMRRMEKRDHCMMQDYPHLWLTDRKLVSLRNLRRFEDYAKRFGYSTPAAEHIPCAASASVVAALEGLSRE